MGARFGVAGKFVVLLIAAMACPGRDSSKICYSFVYVPALVRVPREPVRALARLAAVPRAVDARNARVSTAAAISERMRRERNGFRANATRPLSELFLPKFSPRRFVLPEDLGVFLGCGDDPL